MRSIGTPFSIHKNESRRQRALPMSALAPPACAFTPPPSVLPRHPCGGCTLSRVAWPRLATGATTPGQNSRNKRNRPKNDAAVSAIKSSIAAGNSGTKSKAWQAVPYRSSRTLAERRDSAEPSLALPRRYAGQGGGEAFPGAVDASVEVNALQQQQQQQPQKQRQQQQQQHQQQQEQPQREDSVIVLDDPFEELLLEGDRPRRSLVVFDSLAAPTPYDEGWEWQKQALERLTEHPDDLSEPDVVLLTQHDAVFTLGTASTLDNLKFSPDEAPFAVVRTERGGEVTYHGPGQIVMYPIMNLRRYRQDIHWYLRALEETVIRTLAKLGLRGERIKGLTGVWVEGRKVAAVGVRVKRWVTMHGLSLNVRPDLGHFEHIVPCGIGDRPVGSLEQLLADGEDTSLERVGALLLESFEEVFRVSASQAPLLEEAFLDED